MSKKQAERVLEVPKADASVRSIYIGPALPGLKASTVFVGEVSGKAQQLMNRDVRYKRLFVPVADFSSAIKLLSEGGLGGIYRDAAMERFL